MKSLVEFSLLISLFFPLSCFSTELYMGANEIHPAVVKVFYDNNLDLKKIDIIKNQYFSEYVYQTNFGAKIRYTVNAKFSNNIIAIWLDDIKQFSFYKNEWFVEDRLSFFDDYTLPNKMTNEIYTILSNQSEYNNVKNEVYNNFLFHYLVIKDLSPIEIANWVKNHMLGHKYKLSVTLSKFNRNNTGKLPDMRYIAEFTNSGESKYNNNFVINYFTNSQRYSRFDSKSQFIITGKLVKSFDVADLLINSSHLFLIGNQK